MKLNLNSEALNEPIFNTPLSIMLQVLHFLMKRCLSKGYLFIPEWFKEKLLGYCTTYYELSKISAKNAPACISALKSHSLCKTHCLCLMVIVLQDE